MTNASNLVSLARFKTWLTALTIVGLWSVQRFAKRSKCCFFPRWRDAEDLLSRHQGEFRITLIGFEPNGLTPFGKVFLEMCDMKRVRRGSISQMIGKLSSNMMMAIAVGAVVSILAMSFVMYTANQFLQYSRASVVAGGVLEDGLEARLDALRFRISGNADLSADFSGNVEEVLEGNKLIEDFGMLSGEAEAALSSSASLIAQYEAAFLRIVELREPRNALVANMSDSGRETRQKLSEIMESAYDDGDSVAAAYAGTAQESLLLGRLYSERFLLTNDAESFTRATGHLQESIAGLDALLTELQNPRRRQLAEDAKAGIEEFSSAKNAVFQLITERNENRAEMDSIGPEFIAAVEFVMDGITEQQEVAGQRLRTIGFTVIALLVLSSIFMLFYAKKTSSKTSNYIAGSINKFVTAMTELADGKLEIDLGRPPDKGTELARMADALAIFRDNAEEKLELEKVQAEQEKQKLVEEERQRAREEQSKREAQERIDNERLALLNRLEKSVGGVVESAARGDFSKRIDVDFEEESLRRMAEGINVMVQGVENGLSATSRVVSALSHGDLTKLMEGEFEGAFSDLQTNTNDMIGALKQLVGDISGSSINLASSSSELRDTSDTLSRQAEQNAASLEETSAALEELTASIKQVSENVTEANTNAGMASETAKVSSGVAADAAAAMERISDASQEIAKVVTVINDISFQINLLALNAGVEAARAGEAGRGFSVVASEVRQLAQRAGEAATEIDGVIARSDQAVTEGVEKVSDAQRSLEKISESVVGVSQRIDQIASAISEQVNGIGEINGAVAQIDSNTQKQAASFEEVTATGALLSSEAESLKQSTARFNTGTDVLSLDKAPSRSADEPMRAAEQKPAKAPSSNGNLAEDLAGWDEF